MTCLRSSCIDHGRQGNRDGYTMMKHNKKTVLRHRVVYSLHNGVSLKSMRGFLVRHMCDNPRCVNPEHLLLGTAKDNSRDMVERGRSLKGTQHRRAKLDPEKVQYIREHYKPFCKVHGALPLSKKYGVSTTAIRLARTGANWGSLEGGIHV